MTILDKIIETKRKEVARQKEVLPVARLKNSPDFNRKCNALKPILLRKNASGIIAEFKQKSPSKGEINRGLKVEEVTKSYVDAGASGLSVLTDYEYFGGTLADLSKARSANSETPLLRKDFIIDPYQIDEARAFGADIILLIAACLEKEQAFKLTQKAKSLGMEVLMEIHNSEELNKLNDFVDLVGVNNRNLKTFEVNIEYSAKLAPMIPSRFVKISESGLSSTENIRYLKQHGYKGFLMGETFMRSGNPGETCKKLIKELCVKY